jgi:hypothetical protein
MQHSGLASVQLCGSSTGHTPDVYADPDAIAASETPTWVNHRRLVDKASYSLLLLLLLQVNPLAEDDAGRLIAADAKLGFDDSASYRQKDIFALKDESQLDPRCVWFKVV